MILLGTASGYRKWLNKLKYLISLQNGKRVETPFPFC
jgi:hypothetical protein